jgi:hypothetical protein
MAVMAVVVAGAVGVGVELRNLVEGERKARVVAQQMVRDAALVTNNRVRAVVVRIESPEMIHEGGGGSNVIAHVTRIENTCVIHLLPESVKVGHDRAFTIAHESCHCVIEFDHIGRGGFVTWMSRGELEASEARADACAAEVVLLAPTEDPTVGWKEEGQ